MDNKTLEALKGSIRKWEMIVAGTGKDYCTRNCPLCRLFNNEETETYDECDGCPVREFTGTPLCIGTPYEAWNRSRTNANAAAELEFLKSLLPGSATDEKVTYGLLANVLRELLDAEAAYRSAMHIYKDHPSHQTRLDAECRWDIAKNVAKCVLQNYENS